jgi:hypothetical protein
MDQRDLNTQSSMRRKLRNESLFRKKDGNETKRKETSYGAAAAVAETVALAISAVPPLLPVIAVERVTVSGK